MGDTKETTVPLGMWPKSQQKETGNISKPLVEPRTPGQTSHESDNYPADFRAHCSMGALRTEQTTRKV